MRPTDLFELRQTAVDTALHAGRLLQDFFEGVRHAQVSSKSNPVDLVSTADIESQHLIEAALASSFPHATFIGEESGIVDLPDAEYYWIVDPLDGTSNFLSGLPYWCVSIALVDRELSPLVGAVVAPTLSKQWSAHRGGGCQCNGQEVRVRLAPPGGGLQNCMLATGFPYRVSGGREDTNLANFVHMQRKFHKIRRLGSAAIDLAYIAEGIFDGMWELKLQAWDSAAGVLLVTEAGGLVSRFDLSRYRPGDEDLLAAATPELLEELRRHLAEASQPDAAE